MKEITFDKIVETVKTLCIEAAHNLPDDVLAAIERAIENETELRSKNILTKLIENAKIAHNEQYPLCQDTGVTIVFIEQGSETILKPEGANLFEAVNEGVKIGYREGYLRKSIVYDPIYERKNTQTNTPAIIHHTFVKGDNLKISVMLKGGGCENRSRFCMLKPADGEEGVRNFIIDTVKNAGADACPPFIVGVGIGGNFEYSCLLAKKALLRRLDSAHNEGYYSNLENQILDRINNLGIGPMGMGGKTTALAVLIEAAPCHIASLPVAVNIECHSHRHKTAIL